MIILKIFTHFRRAIELVEMKGQQGQKVTIPDISKVIQEVYGGQVNIYYVVC